MAEFESPTDLSFNRERVEDPEALAREVEAASWLYLCGEEFASMEGGMSYEDIQAAVPVSANVVSDPPRVMARLPPRRVEVRCDRGRCARPRESGRRAVLRSDELEAWVAQGLRELADTQA